MKDRAAVIGAVSACTLALATTAQAQTVTAPLKESPAAATPSDGPQPSSSAQAGDIIVTALKRSSSVQRVPAAVTVVDEGRLKTLGVTNLNQLGNIAPGVAIQPFRTTALVFIRGVGQTLTGPNADPAVAVNVNGVFVPSNVAGSAFFDADRIEILSGPQGALYGRNATGGVLNLNTRTPGRDFAADGFLEVGNYDRIQAVAGLDIPLGDTLATRIAGTVVKHDGYANTGEDDQDSYSVRQTLVWKPSNLTRVTGIATYSHSGGIGNVLKNIPELTCGPRCDSFDAKALGYFNDADVFEGSLEVEQTIADHLTATYLGGYNYVRSHVKNSIFTGPPLAPIDLTEKSSSQSHELRLNADYDRITGVAGLYYFDQVSNYRQEIRPTAAQHLINPFRGKEYGFSAFAQGTFKATDALRLTAGLRFSSTKVDIDGFNSTYNAAEVLTALQPYAGKRNMNHVDWKVGVEYDLAARSMLYASVSTGFTPGGYSTAAIALNPGVQQPAAPFLPVRLTAYTAGLKNRFFGGNLTLNVEGFYYDYRDYQVSARDVASGQSLVFNATKATVYGAQLDARVNLGRNDNLSAGVTYLKATADQLRVGAANFDGFTLPFSPKWTANVFYQHAFDIGSRGAQVRANANFKYTSGRWSIYSHLPGFYQDGNTHTDLTLGYYAASDRWYVQAFVRNLENSVIKQSCGTVLPPSQAGCTFEAPRTYGAQIGFKFR